MLALTLMPRLCLLFTLLGLLTNCMAVDSIAGEGGQRASQGLAILYDFATTPKSSQLIADRSGSQAGVNCRLSAEGAALEETEEILRLSGGHARSTESPENLLRNLKRTGELTLEAWLRPANLSQKGPARIVTLSGNSSERNLTLGQDGPYLQVRLRTTSTSNNGLPELDAKKDKLQTRWTHVVYTRSRSGVARIYIDGKLSAQKQIDGSFSNWSQGFDLLLGDEASGGRAWQGSLGLVALYYRSLSPVEVASNYAAGRSADARPTQSIAEAQPSLFETSIAPLLAEHCLECHDAATRRGGLDLSHGSFALAGSDSGQVIVPGDSAASLLWQAVASDAMPADRTALSRQNKELLARWLNEGAQWSPDFIDPVLYAHGAGVERTTQWLQRLTIPEYVATVEATLGISIADEAKRLLPPDVRADGFSNTAYNLSVDLAHVEAYARLAEIIVSQLDVDEFADRFSKQRRFTDKDMGSLIEAMGKWILRGPLEQHEVIAFRGISTSVASAGGSYTEAVGLIVEAMLQSPRFIYRVERQRGDGSRWPITQYELASRLSYILWGASPDQRLMAVADKGNLATVEQIEEQVSRMLEDPRAAARARQFIAEWLNLSGLDNLQPDREKFPEWRPELAAAMRQETLAYFQQVAWEDDRPLSELLNAPLTFVSPELAEHYGLEVQAGQRQEDSNLLRFSFTNDSSGRGGLLTQGSVLTIGGDNASMVTRGLFVLHNLLRGVVKDPPPCVNTTPVPTRPGLTQRDIALGRIESEACGGCHSRFEPLAFGLERFDGLGTYRETDQYGNPLRQDGNVLVPGDPEPRSYSTSAELMELLATSPRVKESLTWKVAQFALARPLSAADARALTAIHDQAQVSGGSYRDIIRALALSGLVRTSATEPE